MKNQEKILLEHQINDTKHSIAMTNREIRESFGSMITSKGRMIWSAQTDLRNKEISLRNLLQRLNRLNRQVLRTN